MNGAEQRPLSLLLSPAARSAYFGDTLAVAGAELAAAIGERPVVHRNSGGMDFFELEADDSELKRLARLSFVMGLFQRSGDDLRPLTVDPGFLLHEDFVFGNKYRGKTNETLTQLLLNTGLQHLSAPASSDTKLLDPMCGRGTTLLWGMRYGLSCKGIEQDPAALADSRRHLKKWCKLHRQKHRLQEGRSNSRTGNSRARDGSGRFLDFAAGDVGLRVVTGDARDTRGLMAGQRFDLIVSDLPYGVQHQGRQGTRNPLEVIQQCAQGWIASLKPGGAMVLAFNNRLPRRAHLVAAFESPEFELQTFSIPHRMSEAIVRDVVVFRKLPHSP